MTVAKRRWFVHAHLAWMIATALVLSLLNALTYELFFIVSFIGFLVVIELTAPVRIAPLWRRRLRWLTLGSLVVFGYLLAQQVLALLPSGVI